MTGHPLRGRMSPPTNADPRHSAVPAFTIEEVAAAIADAAPITDHAESARVDWLVRLIELLADRLAQLNAQPHG